MDNQEQPSPEYIIRLSSNRTEIHTWGQDTYRVTEVKDEGHVAVVKEVPTEGYEF